MKSVVQFVAAVAAITCLSVSAVQAQNPATQEDRAARGRVQPRSADAVNLDEKTRGTAIRVSQLIGYNIQNSQGESVGEINDIVIDSRTGRVKYAAVTYGGFLGVGNKLFAVPFEAFKVQMDPDEVGEDDVDSDDYVLVLNVTQQQLEGQQGFDEDNWPNMADRQWAADLDRRYGIERRQNAANRSLRPNRANTDQ